MVMDVEGVDDAQSPIGGGQLRKRTGKIEKIKIEKKEKVYFFFLPEWSTSCCLAPRASFHQPVGPEVCPARLLHQRKKEVV